MKTCPECQAITFDDMERCYECMTDLVEPHAQSHGSSVARLKVVLAGVFSYELLLNKLEGRSVSVGSGEENAIVLPIEQVASHQLEIFYAKGNLWVENTNAAELALVSIGEAPLCGTVCAKAGTEIAVGSASITVLEE